MSALLSQAVDVSQVCGLYAGAEDESEYVKNQIEIERNQIHLIVSMMTNYGATGDPKDCKIAMVGYFDECGIHKGNHLCVVAGFVGNQTQWLNFVAEWIEALKPRTQLHMKKLRWAQHPEAVASSLAKLGPIPWKHNLKPVFSGMWMRDYADLLEGKVRAKYTNPYMMCAQSLMGTVLKGIADANDKVSFLFDRQDLHKLTLAALHDLVFKMVEVDPRVDRVETIARPAFNSKIVRNLCVDAADYLAYEIHQYHIDPESDRAKAGISILGDNGMAGIYGSIWTRERLQEAAQQFIAAGMVPGGGQARITPQVLSALLEIKKRARS